MVSLYLPSPVSRSPGWARIGANGAPGIVAQLAADQACRRRQSMRLLRARIENVNDAEAQRDQLVGDETAVTPPPQHLGAHHGCPSPKRQHEQLEQPVRELLARHM